VEKIENLRTTVLTVNQQITDNLIFKLKHKVIDAYEIFTAGEQLCAIFIFGKLEMNQKHYKSIDPITFFIKEFKASFSEKPSAIN
jgi:hypothetical protein